jgi:hypothetical protein
MRRVAIAAVLLSLVTAGVLRAQKAPQQTPQPKKPQPVASPAGQSPSPRKAPQFRPAVLGSGPKSLINQIDVAALMKAGQKDGAVMFAALVAKDGAVVQSRTYRAMPGSEELEKEVVDKLRDANVAPAIYNHEPAEVLFYGTVVFAVIDGKPLVRIFLNQDPAELAMQSDFISPQPVFGPGFTGLTAPQTEHPVVVSAVVDLGLRVDASGKLLGMRLVKEDPPLLGFGEAAVEDFGAAKFIPAFRDGDPADADTVISVFYPAP